MTFMINTIGFAVEDELATQRFTTAGLWILV